MDDDLKPRSLKIGEARWRRWQDEAKARGVPLTALVIERMDVTSDLAGLIAERDTALARVRILECADNAGATAQATTWRKTVITATIDGETKPVLTGRKSKPVTSETAGEIILALQNKVSDLEIALNKARTRPVNPTVAAAQSPVAGSGRSHPSINTKAAHQAGPIMESVVPDVAGHAVGFNPKKNWKEPKA